MLRALAITISLLVSLQSFGGTIDPRVPDEKYVKYGNDHKCVLKLKGKFRRKSEEKAIPFEASAVAIKPYWIATAAHVVQNAEEVRVVIGGREIKVSKIFVEKDFDENKLCKNDIAIGCCDEDLGLDYYPDLYEEEDEVGKVASMCGYGITGNLSTGCSVSDGKKRAGSNIIQRTEEHCLVCVTTDRRTELEFLIGPGDSGGGLFIDGRLAGVNSFVMADDKNPNSDYGDESGHTRISMYRKWIFEVMENETRQKEK